MEEKGGGKREKEGESKETGGRDGCGLKGNALAYRQTWVKQHLQKLLI